MEELTEGIVDQLKKMIELYSRIEDMLTNEERLKLESWRHCQKLLEGAVVEIIT